MTQEQVTHKMFECLKSFRKQYPNLTSADLQTYILGMRDITEKLEIVT